MAQQKRCIIVTALHAQQHANVILKTQPKSKAQSSPVIRCLEGRNISNGVTIRRGSDVFERRSDEKCPVFVEEVPDVAQPVSTPATT
jgi:hypothetical protein